MIFLDSETCGLTGPMVLLQYKKLEENQVHIHKVWREPVRKTLHLLEEICDDDVCAFNLSFDWFHVNKLYNVLYASEDQSRPPVVQEVVRNSIRQPRSFILKPKRALDLFLHSRKTEWQNLMNRKNIVLKRIPRELAQPLADYLTKYLQFPDIYFHKSQEGYMWKVEMGEDGDPNFPSVVLRFKPSGGLKPLCQEIFKVQTYDYPIPKELNPEEDSYNPYSTEWERVIDKTVEYWEGKLPLAYAADDIILLERLYHHFDCPQPGDNDSELAVCVGAVRWHGYAIDEAKVINRLIKNLEVIQSIKINLNAPLQVKRWLQEACPDTEEGRLQKIGIVDTSKDLLERLVNDYSGTPLAERAAIVIQGRKANKEIKILQQLDSIKRFCPDFKVIGAKSGRMSGGGIESEGESINPQGIQHDPEFRELFVLSDDGFEASGGDFKSFEVAITHGHCRDSHLEKDLRSGKSFHGIFGASLYDVSYDEILATKGDPEGKYDKSKTSAFALFYGAFEDRLAKTSGVEKERAKRAIEALSNTYPDWATARRRIHDAFCSMRQPSGIGTAIEWHPPAEFVQSLLGFRRYFTLENKICYALFKLAQNPPDVLHSNVMVKRRDRDQTARGATQSALYACAFKIQADNMRAAANHVIQSTGAEICKSLQRTIWDLQPSGVHSPHVLPMNIHDEVIVTHKPELADKIELVALKLVEVYREVVPLLDIEWKKGIKNWSEK